MDEPRDATGELLAHAAWLRRLARGLVRDANAADDLVQRTWIAALERPPLHGAPLRGWLAAVLKNFVRQDRRTGGRRVVREHVAARPEALPSGSEPLEKLELQRHLMNAVLALPEPYRSVVVRRYYDELAPREIARLTNVPLKTVKAQLARALDKLRERLDRAHDSDRAAWLALAIPWIRGDGAAAGAAGGLIVNAKLKTAIGVAVAVSTVAVVAHWSTPNPPSVARDAKPPAAPATLEDATEHVQLATAAHEERAPAQAVTEKSAKASFVEPNPPAPSTARIHGRVADLSGSSIANIDVYSSPSTAAVVDRARSTSIARTDARGAFECERPRSAARLEAENESWTTVLAAAIETPRGTNEFLIVVAPKIAVHGRVVDEAHQPIAGAHVIVQFGDALRSSFAGALDDAIAMCPEATADADGHFEFAVVPACPGGLLVQQPGYDMKSAPIPDRSTFDVEIVLGKTPDKHTIVRGIVVDAQKRPIEDALVSHGAAIEHTKADGTFEFDFAHALGNTEMSEDETQKGAFKRNFDWLCAVKAGFRAVRVPLPTSTEIRATEPFYTLVLADPPLSIHGRVVDADGAAVRDADVWIGDPTPFGCDVLREGEMWMTWKTSVEDALRTERSSRGTKADSDGKFALDGLLDRDYTVVAFDPATMRWMRVEHILAGRSDVVLALPRQVVERVAGRVVSRRGKPIPNAQVHAGRSIDPKEPTRFTATRMTDAEGRFDFGEIVAEALHFQITGEHVKVEVDIVPPRDARPSALELRASVECHVQVDLGERRSLADSFAVFDAQGERKDMLAYRGSGALVGETFAIENGISEVVVVDESCTDVVLYKDAKEVERVPLVLDANGVTIVRP